MTVQARGRRFEIRPVAPDELEAILEVYRRCEDFLSLGPQPSASKGMVQDDLRHSKEAGGVFCGIYATDGEMVGIIDYVPAGFEGDPHVAFLSLLMIAAPFRGQGLGAAVVQAVEGEIRKQAEVTAIASGVQVNNPRAVRFWQGQGYRIVSGPRHHPDQTTAFDLRKELGTRA